MKYDNLIGKIYPVYKKVINIPKRGSYLEGRLLFGNKPKEYHKIKLKYNFLKMGIKILSLKKFMSNIFKLTQV